MQDVVTKTHQSLRRRSAELQKSMGWTDQQFQDYLQDKIQDTYNRFRDKIVSHDLETLTAWGRKLGDLIEAKDVINFHPEQADILNKHSRAELRAMNEKLKTADLSQPETFEMLYDEGFISETEYEVYQMVQDLLPPHFFADLDIQMLTIDPNTRGHILEGEYQGQVDTLAYLAGLNDIIRLFHARDARTFIHELGHRTALRGITLLDYEYLQKLYLKSDAYKKGQERVAAGESAYGYNFSEWFADGFANYVLGTVDMALTKEQHDIFYRFSKFLQKIYDSVKSFLKMEPELVQFLDDLVLRKQAVTPDDQMRVAAAEAVSRVGPALQQSEERINDDDVAKTVEQKQQLVNEDQESIERPLQELSDDQLLKKAEGGDQQAWDELEYRTETTDNKAKRHRNGLMHKAHVAERKTGFTDDEILNIKKWLTGKESMSNFSDEEIEKYQEELELLDLVINSADSLFQQSIASTGATKAESERVLKAAKGDTIIGSMILQKRKRAGGYSTKDLTMRQRQVNRDAKWAKDLYKQTEKQTHDNTASQIGLINDLTAMRYLSVKLESRTGTAVYEQMEGLEDSVTSAEASAWKTFSDILAKPGKRTGRPIKSNELAKYQLQSPLIGEALYEKNTEKKQKLFNQLTDAQKDVYDKMHEILQGPAANAIRELRFWQWERAVTAAEKAPTKRQRAALFAQADKLVPHDLRKDDTERKRVLREGRDAIKNNTLKEWIAGETFGTREYYYPSEVHNNTSVNETLLHPNEFRIDQAKGKIEKDSPLAAMQARRGHAGANTKPVLQAVMNHMRQAIVKNAMKEHYTQFKGMMDNAKLQTDDAKVLNRWLDNLIGVKQDANTFVRASEFLNNTFWRAYPLQIARIAHFFVRNIMQPFYALGSMPAGSMAMGAVRYWSGKGNKDMGAELSDRWETVSQMNTMQQEYMLLREAASRNEMKSTGRVGDNMRAIFDKLGKIIPLSDEWDRRLTFPIFHEAAHRVASLYASGKMNLNTLRSRIQLDTLAPPQVEKLEGFLAEGNVKDFAFWLARYKTENIFFKYGRSSRSMMEQSRHGRLLAGLITYPRGLLDKVVQNSVKPMHRAVRDKDLRAGWQGVYNFVGFAVGARLAMELARVVMGKREFEDYSWRTMLGYSPLSVGASKMLDLMMGADHIIKTPSGKMSKPEQVAKYLVDNITFALPLVDVYIAMAASMNDKETETFYKTVRRQITGKGNRVRMMDRNALETAQLFIFGGNQKQDRSKGFGEMSDAEKANRFITGAVADR
jgi:hypothetical protein